MRFRFTCCPVPAGQTGLKNVVRILVHSHGRPVVFFKNKLVNSLTYESNGFCPSDVINEVMIKIFE